MVAEGMSIESKEEVTINGHCASSCHERNVLRLNVVTEYTKNY